MKKLFTVLPVIALACSVNAHAGFWDEVNKAVGILGAVTGTSSSSSTSTSSSNTSGSSSSRLAQITPAQEQRINQLVKANTNNPNLNRAILEAKPNIEGFLKISSCQTSGYTVMLGRFRSPDSSNTSGDPVMPQMGNHPTQQCVSVASIGGWELESQDILSFNLVYVSDTSSESRNIHVQMKREPDGQWYVVHHYNR